VSKLVPAEVSSRNRFQTGDRLCQVEFGLERRDLLHQPIDQLLGAANGQRRNIVDRLVGIQFGALPAYLSERVHHVGMNVEQPQFEDLEQAAGTRADDDYVCLDRHVLFILAKTTCARVLPGRLIC